MPRTHVVFVFLSLLQAALSVPRRCPPGAARELAVGLLAWKMGVCEEPAVPWQMCPEQSGTSLFSAWSLCSWSLEPGPQNRQVLLDPGCHGVPTPARLPLRPAQSSHSRTWRLCRGIALPSLPHTPNTGISLAFHREFLQNAPLH